jgi:hypothetical protein
MVYLETFCGWKTLSGGFVRLRAQPETAARRARQEQSHRQEDVIETGTNSAKSGCISQLIL